MRLSTLRSSTSRIGDFPGRVLIRAKSFLSNFRCGKPSKDLEMITQRAAIPDTALTLALIRSVLFMVGAYR